MTVIFNHNFCSKLPFLSIIATNAYFVFCSSHDIVSRQQFECKITIRRIKYKPCRIKSFAEQEIDFRNNKIQFTFICSAIFFHRSSLFICDPVFWCSEWRTVTIRWSLQSTRHLTFDRSMFSSTHFSFVATIAIESKFYYEYEFTKKKKR